MNIFKSLRKSGVSSVTEEQKSAVTEFDAALETLQKSEDQEDNTSLESNIDTEASETSEGTKGEKTSSENTESSDESPEETKKSKSTDSSKEKEDELVKSESLEEIINTNEEASAAMDVEPFLKSLVEGVSEVVSDLTKSFESKIKVLEDKLEDLGNLQKAQSDVLVAEGKLIKSVLSVDSESLNEPLERQGVLTADRFFKSSNGEQKKITKAEALAKLGELAKSKALTPREVSTVENRINGNGELPSFFTRHFEEKE